MRSTPEVSVLMSVHNGGSFLAPAINSILNQTFTDFEFIVVDDGSTDETSEVLAGQTDERVRILRNATNFGLAVSLNRALRHARGQLIARMDADDVSASDRLERQVRFLESHPNIAVLGTYATRIDAASATIEVLTPPASPPEIREYAFEQGNPFVHGSVVMRATSLKNVNGYDERFDVAQDYDLWLRVLEREDGANLPEYLYGFRLLNTSLSGTKAYAQRASHELAMALSSARRSGTPMSDEEIDARFLAIVNQDFSRSLKARTLRIRALHELGRCERKSALCDAIRAWTFGFADRDNFWVFRKALAAFFMPARKA